MASDSASVPTWDGSAKGWRRYCREVTWLVQSTKVVQRRHLATRLIAKLTGSARLLAMSWSQAEFDSDRGVINYLQRLAKSPLVRRSLPNAAAIMNQYFSFKRLPNENISSFLVREGLAYEEFQEALLRLKEEREGFDPAAHDFGLTEILRRGEEHEWWSQDKWKQSWQTGGIDVGTAMSPHGDVGSVPPSSPQGAVDDDDGQRPDAVSQGYARLPQQSEHAPSPAATESPVRRPGITELSQHDSFILDVLRGWRLLVAASLSHDEWRDVLSSTNNRLDWESISNALQVLWDDQMLQPRSGSSFATGSLHMADHAADAFTSQYDEWSSWDDGWWHDDGSWHDTQAALWSGQEWPDASADAGAFAAESTEPQPAELEDEAVRETLQSERVAEALAAEAKMTWQKAQETTAALRRDRGFGQVKGTSKGKTASSSGCWICGSPQHFSKDCPDRFHPGKGKRPSKFGMSMEPWSSWDSDAMVFQKGYGGKGFGKSKKGYHANYVDDLFWTSKGKYGKGKPRLSTPTVNAYGMEVLYPLELLPSSSTSWDVSSPLSISSTSQATMKPQEGLLDSGATASAGPDASVRRLLQCLRRVDSQAVVETDLAKRPLFRFGSGKWGRALCQVRTTSSASGSPRTFHVFVLPNPEEFYESWFTPDQLVPILIGMDFLRPQGLVMDFTDGMAQITSVTGSQPFFMSQNSKGHFVLDLVAFLTGSLETPSTTTMGRRVTFTEESPQVLDDHMMFCGMTVMDDHVPTNESLRRDFFQQLVTRHLPHTSSLTSQPASAQMTCAPCTNHPEHLLHDHDLQGQQAQGESSRAQLGSCDSNGSEGSQSLARRLAMFQSSQRIRERLQQVCGMVPLRNLWNSHQLCSTQGVSVDPPAELRLQASGTGPEHAPEGPEGRKAQYEVGDCSHQPCDPPGDLPGHAAGTKAEFPSRNRAVEDSDDTGNGIPSSHAQSILSTPVDLDKDQYTAFRDQGAPRAAALDTPDASGDGRDSQESSRTNRGQPRESKSVRAGPVRTAVSLPLRVAKAAMAMVALVAGAAASSLQELVTEPQQHYVWEICCAPQSWLSEACQRLELKPFRVNLANNFDLNKQETYDRMWDLFLVHRPRKLWISMRCTVWCAWQSLNYQTEAAREVLESRRRRERSALRHLTRWLLRALQHDPMVDVYWEWPLRCDGWHQQVMLDFEYDLWNLSRDWQRCRIDGCRYHLKSGEPGCEHEFLLKRWLIKTTDLQFHARFKTKVCTQNHTHKPIQGRDTTRSSYYPWGMVNAIANFWRQQLFPASWLNKLHIAEDILVPDEVFVTQTLGITEYDIAPENDMMPLEPLQDEFENVKDGRSNPPKWTQVGHERWQRIPSSSQSTTSKPLNASTEPEPSVSEKERAEWRVRLGR